MRICVNYILITHQLAGLKNEKEFFFMLAIISLKLAAFARENQRLPCGEGLYI